MNQNHITSATRQKGKSQNGYENKARQIFRQTIISYPLIRTRTCQNGWHRFKDPCNKDVKMAQKPVC